MTQQASLDGDVIDARPVGDGYGYEPRCGAVNDSVAAKQYRGPPHGDSPPGRWDSDGRCTNPAAIEVKMGVRLVPVCKTCARPEWLEAAGVDS